MRREEMVAAADPAVRKMKVEMKLLILLREEMVAVAGPVLRKEMVAAVDPASDETRMAYPLMSQKEKQQRLRKHLEPKVKR